VEYIDIWIFVGGLADEFVQRFVLGAGGAFGYGGEVNNLLAPGFGHFDGGEIEVSHWWSEDAD
jgi:hypothetical protein